MPTAGTPTAGSGLRGSPVPTRMRITVCSSMLPPHRPPIRRAVRAAQIVPLDGQSKGSPTHSFEFNRGTVTGTCRPIHRGPSLTARSICTVLIDVCGSTRTRVSQLLHSRGFFVGTLHTHAHARRWEQLVSSVDQQRHGRGPWPRPKARQWWWLCARVYTTSMRCTAYCRCSPQRMYRHGHGSNIDTDTYKLVHCQQTSPSWE
jgi:hypothetical protein